MSQQPVASFEASNSAEQINRSGAARSQHRHHSQSGEGGGGGRRHAIAAVIGLCSWAHGEMAVTGWGGSPQSATKRRLPAPAAS